MLVLGSGYIRRVAAQPGPLHDCAAFVVGFVNSREDQWLTATCVGVYFVSLTFYHCLLRNRITGGLGAGGSGIAVARWSWPEVLLGLGIGWAAARYAFNYQTSYPRMDFLTLLAGAAAGQAVAVTRLRRAGMGRPRSFHQEALPLLILTAALAAMFHPDMGESYQYRGHARWTGPCFDPNTFGVLMGAGIVLAGGGLVQSLRSKVQSRPSAEGGGQGLKSKVQSLKSNAYRALLLAVAAGVMGVGLVKSYSRGAWVGAVVGVAWLAYQIGKAEMLKGEASGGKTEIPGWVSVLRWAGRRWVTLAIICASGGLLGFWSCRLTERAVARRAVSVVNANDFSWNRRLVAYEGALRMLADKPWFGFGWNEPERVYGALYCPAKVDEGMAIRLNDYLMLGMTLGLPALLCFVMYVGLSLRASPKSNVQCPKFQAVNPQIMAQRLENSGQQSEDGRPGKELPAPPTLDFRLWTLDSAAVCRAGAIVLLVGFWFDGGLFRLAAGATFWILLELGREA